tara:strand:- start:60942 stop:62840 length:1899 start_codon:yes stop_codon:yes gene_type:complete
MLFCQKITFLIVCLLLLSTSVLPAVVVQEDNNEQIEQLLEESQALAYDNFSAALLKLQEAYDLSKKVEDNLLTAEVLYTSGWVYYVKGKYQESLIHFNEGLSLFKQQDAQKGVAKSLIGTGLVIQAIDRHKEAIALFERVLAIYTTLEMPERKAPTYINLAISYIELKNYIKAQEVLNLAFDLANQYDLEQIKHHYHNKAGEVAFQTGQYQAAAKHHLAVLEHATEPNAWEKSYAHAGLAQAYLKLNAISKAEFHGIEALKFAEGSESLWELERNTAILAAVFAAKGATEEAYQQLKASQKYHDSLYDLKTLQLVNILQLEEKENENKRLTSEVALKESELQATRWQLIGLVILALLLLFILFLLWKNNRQKEIFAKELAQKNKTIEHNQELILKRNIALNKINANKDKFFAIISHDLRAPMLSIKQMLDLVEQGVLDIADSKNLEHELKMQVEKTLVMIDNLLNWSQSQLDGVLVKPIAINLPKTVAEIIEIHQVSADFKNITIIHKAVAEIPLIRVDSGHLSVFLHNLISNAIKFTYEGKKIFIEYRITPNKVNLYIRDQGMGIAQGKLEPLKQTQEQILSSIGTAMETGTGLGLMLVKQFLKLNDAQLDVQSTPGEGSEFILSFNMANR